MQDLSAPIENRQLSSQRRSTGGPRPETEAANEPRTIVVDLHGTLGGEFAARGTSRGGGTIIVTKNRRPECIEESAMTCADFLSSTALHAWSVARLIVFLPRKPSKSFALIIDQCVSLAAANNHCRVCIVSSFRAYFGDGELSAFEDTVMAKFLEAAESITIIRAGNIVAPIRLASVVFREFAPFYPLVPRTISSVFLGAEELFSAIDAVTGGTAASRRRVALLGEHRPLRDMLAEFAQHGRRGDWRTALAWILSCLQIERVAGMLLSVAGRWHRQLQRWQVTTLAPASVTDLLSLYNPLNKRHVALAGYNTGVTHFGWKFPGRTVVRTTSSGRRVRVRGDMVEVDAGVLLKRVMDVLSAHGKELYVVPNYSYISMGTTFMVPVHGSGSEVSALGDTIERALIYDPAADRIVRATRGDGLFRRYMYNSSSGILVLRLRLRIRDKSRYFVKRSRLESPSGAEIWRVFSDPDAANVELRKSKAAASSVDVRKYYQTPSDGQGGLEIPRDSIGRLWDRLEENAVTSWLFHAYVRKHGFHVELFLDEREFDIFWRAHTALPLSKIQLRFVKCDGLPHSPFGDSDRISVDIFMKRRNSAAFLSFMKEHLPDARFNPGKHSA